VAGTHDHTGFDLVAVFLRDIAVALMQNGQDRTIATFEADAQQLAVW